MTNTHKCEHPACNCMTEPGKKHCSTACSDSKKGVAEPCGCEHKECKEPGLKT